MKIIEVKSLAIEAVKVIRFARFGDQRGYFTEIYRKSDFEENPDLSFMRGVEFVQTNESCSKKGTVRGLHFQWNPYVGKLIRTLSGRMVDMVLDIRKGSPTFGKIICYDMPTAISDDYNEWIWIPPGFAHGNFFDRETKIEYFCSGRYNPQCEAEVSPLSADIDWSLCDKQLKKLFDEIAPATNLITDKDKNGFSVSGWKADRRSENFVYGKL